MRTFAEILRTERKARKLSQRKLAALAGVAYQTVVGWELGLFEPKLSNAAAITDVFGLTIDELIDRRIGG